MSQRQVSLTATPEAEATTAVPPPTTSGPPLGLSLGLTLLVLLLLAGVAMATYRWLKRRNTGSKKRKLRQLLRLSYPDISQTDQDITVNQELYEVKHDYEGQTENEIDLEQGDVIEVLQKMDTGWWRGKTQKKEGWFPATFVKETPIQRDATFVAANQSTVDVEAGDDDNAQADVTVDTDEVDGVKKTSIKIKKKKVFIALFPYLSSGGGQMTIAENDVITCEEENLDGWLRGVKPNGDEGWVPKAYLRAADSTDNTRLSEIHMDDLADSEGEFEEEEVVAVEYRAKYSYSEQQVGDLAFESGDVILVFEMQKSGWWRGCIDDRVGWFPATYVEMNAQKTRNGKSLLRSLSEEPESEDVQPEVSDCDVTNMTTSERNLSRFGKRLKESVRQVVFKSKNALADKSEFIKPKLVQIPGKIRKGYSTMRKRKWVVPPPPPGAILMRQGSKVNGDRKQLKPRLSKEQIYHSDFERHQLESVQRDASFDVTDATCIDSSTPHSQKKLESQLSVESETGSICGTARRKKLKRPTAPPPRPPPISPDDAAARRQRFNNGNNDVTSSNTATKEPTVTIDENENLSVIGGKPVVAVRPYQSDVIHSEHEESRDTTSVGSRESTPQSDDNALNKDMAGEHKSKPPRKKKHSFNLLKGLKRDGSTKSNRTSQVIEDVVIASETYTISPAETFKAEVCVDVTASEQQESSPLQTESVLECPDVTVDLTAENSNSDAGNSSDHSSESPHKDDDTLGADDVILQPDSTKEAQIESSFLTDVMDVFSKTLFNDPEHDATPRQEDVQAADLATEYDVTGTPGQPPNRLEVVEGDDSPPPPLPSSAPPSLPLTLTPELTPVLSRRRSAVATETNEPFVTDGSPLTDLQGVLEQFNSLTQFSFSSEENLADDVADLKLSSDVTVKDEPGSPVMHKSDILNETVRNPPTDAAVEAVETALKELADIAGVFVAKPVFVVPQAEADALKTEASVTKPPRPNAPPKPNALRKSPPKTGAPVKSPPKPSPPKPARKNRPTNLPQRSDSNNASADDVAAKTDSPSRPPRRSRSPDIASKGKIPVWVGAANDANDVTSHPAEGAAAVHNGASKDSRKAALGLLGPKPFSRRSTDASITARSVEVGDDVRAAAGHVLTRPVSASGNRDYMTLTAPRPFIKAHSTSSLPLRNGNFHTTSDTQLGSQSTEGDDRYRQSAHKVTSEHIHHNNNSEVQQMKPIESEA